jgi:hypothetical protein
MTNTVVTSRKAAKYHVDENCPGWLQGRNNSQHLDRDLHEVLRISEAEAVRMKKKPCLRCGGRP